MNALLQEMEQYSGMSMMDLEGTLLRDWLLLLHRLNTGTRKIKSIAYYLFRLHETAATVLSVESISRATGAALQSLLSHRDLLLCLESWLSGGLVSRSLWMQDIEAMVERWRKAYNSVCHQLSLLERLATYLSYPLHELDNYREYSLGREEVLGWASAVELEHCVQMVEEWLIPLQLENRLFLEYFMVCSENETVQPTTQPKYYCKSVVVKHFLGGVGRDTNPNGWTNLTEFNDSINAVRVHDVNLLESKLAFLELVDMENILYDDFVSTEVEMELLLNFFRPESGRTADRSVGDENTYRSLLPKTPTLCPTLVCYFCDVEQHINFCQSAF